MSIIEVGTKGIPFCILGIRKEGTPFWDFLLDSATIKVTIIQLLMSYANYNL